MRFGENMQFLRKQNGLTQEDLAEKMEVSRQTVSKWESGQSFPETEKLIVLCDLFGCDLDTLLRGDVRESAATDSAGYDRHQNRFTAAICGGVFSVLFGLFSMLLSYGLNWDDTLSALLFFAFLVIAVAIFIVAGISHGEFVKAHPNITPFYTEERVCSFNRRFPIFIAAPTVLILFGVMWLIGADALSPADMAREVWEYVYTSVFFLILAAAVPMYIYGGMQKAKYDIEEYNKEHTTDPQAKRRRSIAGQISACIMLIATAVFLLLGFYGNYWNIAWVVYPIGALLCGIVSVISEKAS